MTCPLDDDSIVLLLAHELPYIHKTGTTYRFQSCRHQYCTLCYCFPMNTLTSIKQALLTDSYHVDSNTVYRHILNPNMWESDSNWDNPLTHLHLGA